VPPIRLLSPVSGWGIGGAFAELDRQLLDAAKPLVMVHEEFDCVVAIGRQAAELLEQADDCGHGPDLVVDEVQQVEAGGALAISEADDVPGHGASPRPACEQSEQAEPCAG